jgi:hypothetical protein
VRPELQVQNPLWITIKQQNIVIKLCQDVAASTYGDFLQDKMDRSLFYWPNHSKELCCPKKKKKKEETLSCSLPLKLEKLIKPGMFQLYFLRMTILNTPIKLTVVCTINIIMIINYSARGIIYDPSIIPILAHLDIIVINAPS